MISPTRRDAVVFPERIEYSDQVTCKESNAVFVQQSQASTPRESFANSVYSREQEIITTSVFSQDFVHIEKWKQTPKRLMDSWIYTAVSILFVVFTLFGDSLRQFAAPKEADDVFTALFVLSLCFFSLDLLVLLALRSDYRWSVSFFFDIFATLTLVMDINWLWDSIEGGLGNYGKTIIGVSGKASRVASRTLRLIKLLRILRVIRVMKTVRGAQDFEGLKSDSALKERVELFNKKNSFERKMRVFQSVRRTKPGGVSPSTRHSRISISPSDTKDHDLLKKKRTFDRLYEEKRVEDYKLDRGYFDIPVESKVSKVITDRTMKQVFCILLLSAFFMPYFMSETYANPKSSYLYGLELINANEIIGDYQASCNMYVEKHQGTGNLATLLRLTHRDVLIWASETRPEELRSWETQVFSVGQLTAVFDLRTQTQFFAVIDISTVFFLCSMLLISGVLVTHDIYTTVLFGVERMIILIRKIARNPLLLLTPKSSSDEMPTQSCCCYSQTAIEYGTYEMKLLEEALHKIGVMLALGLGTAGCEIITRNIKAAGRLDPMIPGKKVLAAFCFIGIRGFDVLTDLLGAKLLIYLNKLSKIVHGSTERYQGAINRNLGESYFAIWKFEEDDGVVHGAHVLVNPYSMSVRLRTALALIASIKTLGKVAKSMDMARLLDREGMHAVGQFLQEQVSVGLHVGWAFEGPVGSAFKIDATYLSPHVNKTARLESATRMYSVPLLASGDFVDRLDEEIKHYFRHIDTVILKGTADAMSLFTFDLDLKGLGISSHEMTKEAVVKQKEKMWEAFEFNYFNVHELFTQSEKIAKMRVNFTPFFYKIHQLAMNHYIAGRWEEARELFYACLNCVPEDGPTRNVLTFMEKQSLHAPEGWTGVRFLGSK